MYVNASKNYSRLGELDRTEFISRENDGLYLTYRNEKLVEHITVAGSIFTD